MRERSIAPAARRSAPISPAAHAVLDYAVAATFSSVGAWLMPRHRGAASLAFANGAMVTALSMLTDYPGGILRVVAFRGHRTGDVVQAAFAGLGPILFGSAGDDEARFFYAQAASEVAVIAATDWDAVNGFPQSQSTSTKPARRNCRSSSSAGRQTRNGSSWPMCC
jgi:hypothetical protein